eukprot:1438602-Amphidinium_carterae.1
MAIGRVFRYVMADGTIIWCGADPAKLHQIVQNACSRLMGHMCAAVPRHVTLPRSRVGKGSESKRGRMADDAVIAEVLPADAGGGADGSTVASRDAVLLPPRILWPLWPQVWFVDGKTRQCSRYEQQELWMKSTVGGLRRSAGLKARLALYKFFQQRSETVSTCYGAISRDSVEALTNADAAGCHHVMVTALGIEDCHGTLCNLWDAFSDWWVKYAGDPDDQVGRWLCEGAPMGLRSGAACCRRSKQAP